MKIKTTPWLFKYILRGYSGITIYPFILVESLDDITLLNHERIHWHQQRRDGLIRFFIRYCYEYIRNRFRGYSHWRAYAMISYEREAYSNEDNVYYKISSRKEFNLFYK